MFSELIVMVMPGKEDADKVWLILDRSHSGQLFKLIDVVLVQRDAAGKVSFQMYWQEFDSLVDHRSRLVSLFAETIFGISKAEGRHQLAEAGMDPLFLHDVDQALKPDSSAYMIYVPRDGRIESRRYVEILGRLEGDLYHTTFGQQVEEAFLKQQG